MLTPGLAMAPLGEFISGWAYWLSAWLGNLVFVTMLMSAIGTFIPVFKGGSNLPSIIVAIIFCWALTFLVNNGVESASFVNTIGTFCKVVPLIMFVIISFKSGMFTADFWGRVANKLSKGTTTGSVWTQMKFRRERKERGAMVLHLLAAAFQFICMFLQYVLVVSLSYIPGLIIYYQNVCEKGRKLNKNEIITYAVIWALCQSF